MDGQVSPTHGTIKWGHVSCTDLLRWTPEPIALTNRPGELDSYGCWSGCVVVDGGVPTAVYSAVADATHRSEVLLARSDRRMTSWVQDHKSVARQPADDRVSQVRDPYVFTSTGTGARYRAPATSPAEGGSWCTDATT